MYPLLAFLPLSQFSDRIGTYCSTTHQHHHHVMEELQCCLLGFSSASLGGGAASSSSARPSTSGHGSSTLPQELRDCLHPSEVELMEAVLPLGEAYVELHNAARRVLVGRARGLYPSAVGAGVGKVLNNYVAAVKAAHTPADLSLLRSTYGLTFRLLCNLVKELEEPADGSLAAATTSAAIADVQQFVANKEVPLAFRAMMGESVWLSVLYTVAHYIAHGTVLHGRDDFFISVARPPRRGVEEAPTRAATEAEDYILHRHLLPPAISTDLGMLILTAGKERHALLREAELYGHDYLEQLAMGVKDEAADAVFSAIFNPSLCDGGCLVVEELAARVEAAKALWSKALWMKVGQSAALTEHLDAVRDMFLCHRGDVWFGFVEYVFDRLLATRVDGVEQPPSRPSTVGLLQRIVVDALTYAKAHCGLSERPAFDAFEVVMQNSFEDEEGAAAAYGQSVEDGARLSLQYVQDISLQYEAPAGVPLIISNKAMRYYESLFSFHLGMRVSLHSLNATRQFFVEAMRGNRHPSSDLRKAYSMFQMLHFLHTSLCYYAQVDVIAMHSAELQHGMRSCGSVSEAKHRHDHFIWSVAEGSFLTAGSEPLLEACRAMWLCAMTLFRLCVRYRLTSWSVSSETSTNTTPVEVAACLGALHTRLHQDVLSPLMGFLSVATRAWERALWARLDFSRYFSTGCGGWRASPFAGAVPHSAPPTTTQKEEESPQTSKKQLLSAVAYNPAKAYSMAPLRAGQPLRGAPAMHVGDVEIEAPTSSHPATAGVERRPAAITPTHAHHRGRGRTASTPPARTTTTSVKSKTPSKQSREAPERISRQTRGA